MQMHFCTFVQHCASEIPSPTGNAKEQGEGGHVTTEEE
jgi:hypothetical protein